MTGVTTTPFSLAAARRAARQRWAIRVWAGLALSLALAYATIPWWLPTERLRRQLETQLSDDLGVPVRIANLRAGWLEGVVIKDLTIASTNGTSSAPEDNGRARAEPIARIGQIRCDLSPFTVITSGTLRELEITDPQIWLEIDDAGQLKLPQFNTKSGGKLPSLNYSVRGLMCHVIAPAVAQSFRIDRLDLQLDPSSGLLHLTSVTRVKRPNPDAYEPTIGRLDFDANLRIPRLNRSERLNGNIEVEWSDLALTDLPVPLISHVPVEQVDGTTSGRLTIQTRPDLGIDYSVGIAFNHVQIMRPDLNRPARVPDAELACNGHWDPTEGVLVVKELGYETPAIKIESIPGGDSPAFRSDEDADDTLEAHIRGTIKDWRQLRDELPDVDHVLRTAGVEVEGEAVFVATASRGLREDRVALTIDAHDSLFNVTNNDTALLNADQGLAKAIKIEASRERFTGLVRLPMFSLRLGDTVLEASGELLLPPTGNAAESAEDLDSKLAETIATLRAHAGIRCNNAVDLKKLVPCLSALPEIQDWSGPFDARLDIDPQGEWSRIQLAANLAPESTLRAGELIHKRKDRALQLRAEARLPYAAIGRVDLLNLNARYGAGELELSSHNGSLEYHLDLRQTAAGTIFAGVEGSWHTDVHVRSVEDFVDLLPQAAKALKESGLTFLAGQFDVNARADFSFLPEDLIVRTRASVLADDLAVRWKDRITKQAGDPVRIDVSHHLRQCTDGRDEHWAATLIQPAGTIYGSALLSQDRRQNASPPVQLLEFRAEFDDVAEGINLLSSAADQVDLHATGGLSASARVLRSGDWQAGRADIDLGRSELADSRDWGLRKPAGLPLDLHLAWEAGPDAQAAGRQRWTLTDCRARLGTAELEQVDATFMLDDAIGVNDASAHVSGSVAFNEAIAAVHPRVRQILHELKLEGETNWNVTVNVDSDRISASGDINVSPMGFCAPLQSEPAQQLTKSVDQPLSFGFDVSAPRSAKALPENVTINRATLELASNSVSAEGMLTISRESEDLVRPARIKVKANLPRLEEILNYVPTAPIETLKGGLQADVYLIEQNGKLEMDAGRAEFTEVQFGPASTPLNLDGACTFNRNSVNVEQLDWSWGESSGSVSGTLLSDGDRYDVRLGFGGRELRVEDLLKCAGEMQASLEPEKQQQAANPAAQTNPVPAIIDLLRRTQVRMDGHAETIMTPLPLGIKATIDAGWQELKLENSVVAMDFGCLVDGGCVTGQVSADLNAAEPKYRLTYTADRIQPGALVDAYLRRTFPGMVANGPLTLIDETNQKLLPAPGEPNPEIGKGELIIDGGTVSGRAAPMWMTRIFPNLNLSSFAFSRMHSWFDKAADSRVHHQMIYHGDYYNVYMIGWGDPHGYFDYEVGIDFLAGLESEYWANTGQGRVPLFNKTGRVLPDGSLADETVTFVSFTRVLESLFVRNNPIVTAYHAVRKRAIANN